MPHDLAAWSVGIGIELDLVKEFPDDLLMLLGLLQVLFPLLLKIIVNGTAYRRLIDQHPAHLGFQGFIKKLIQLFVFYCLSLSLRHFGDQLTEADFYL
jgi:hypothetical protein